MNALLPLEHSLPLFTAASSRDIEALALRDTPDLMARAGLACAKLALALRHGNGPIWVVCGPGNNGGDGLIAARHLQELGLPVHISAPGADMHAPAHCSLLIDALLGLGLKRPPSDLMRAAIEVINATKAPVLSVDLPSGLLVDTGQPAGSQAVRADHTLALLTLKPGLFTGEGRAHTGRLWFNDLGVGPTTPPDAWLLGLDALLEPTRSASSHKGSHGEVRVVGGAQGLQGAARLAARSALACGAGRVYLELLDNSADGADALWPELMRWRGGEADVVVAGCGGGEAIAARLAPILRSNSRLVLDADALNALAADAGLRALLKARSAPSLLTPHPLEAARLSGMSTTQVQADRLSAAQSLADGLACTVLLKGSGSVIASPGETPAINASGGPALATAGTGDVLAGWLGGLWAQAPQTSAHALACSGVHAHGLAGESPLTRAGDLIPRLSASRART